MARKFFITGGTGLIGRALVRALLRRREVLDIDQLTLLSRNPERFRTIAPDIANAPGIRLIQGDMATGEWPQEPFTDIVHGATEVNDRMVSDRFAYAWSIAEGTKRTLEYAETSGCQRYLYLSSGAVYGPGAYPDTGIPETWSTAPSLESPHTAYGQAKRFSEHLCSLLAERSTIAVRIARIFSVIGPEIPLDGQYALGNFIRQAVSPGTDTIRIKGDGTATRSYLHVDDLARWLIALHEQGPHCCTFNLGSQREITIRGLAEMVSKFSDQKKLVIVEDRISNYAGRSRYFPNCEALRKELGVVETLSLELALDSVFTKARNLHVNL